MYASNATKAHNRWPRQGVAKMKFMNPYWSNKLKIAQLQRWVLVHSILYYEMSTSIVSDKAFDANAQQLVQMQNEFPDDAKATQYWYVFNDFDGSTGFDLPGRLKRKDKKYLVEIAQNVLRLYNEEVNDGKEKANRKGNNRR